MTLQAVPKPARAERLQAQAEKAAAKREDNERASRKKQRESYGGSDWQASKAACLSREGHRCVFRCVNQFFTVTVHHWQRTVGAGGTNALSNLAAVCAFCHDDLHAGRKSREEVKAALVALHGPDVLTTR